MTGATIVPQPTARSELLLQPGAWEQYAAAYLLAHPQISAAIPAWADEVDFLNIEDEVEGTVFSFSRTIRDVELYGGGKLLPNGRVVLYEGGTPNIYITSELRGDRPDELAEKAVLVSEDLTTAASLLRTTRDEEENQC